MSSRSDQYEDDRYAEEEDRRWLPYAPSWGWGGAWGVWPFASQRDEEVRYEEEGRYDEEPRYDETGYEGAGDSPHDDDDNGSLWDESLITLLIIGGVVLFLFPEPATSALGILLLAIGVIAWLVDWAL